jgi:peptidoglycan-N-acetylglucosamine deacetylase
VSLSRREAIKLGATFLGGAAVSATSAETMLVASRHGPFPVYGSIASALHADRKTPPRHPELRVWWGVNTSKQLVALTFDDGPMPAWTPDVLDILDDRRASATFFMIGANAAAHRDLVAGRLGRHEVGNHTWDHHDLARLDYAGVRREIEQAHTQLVAITGQEPRLLRPPYGHVGGTTLLAATDLGYSLALWNLQMLESDYRSNPQGLADYVVRSTTPGTILLAHDTGETDRMLAIRELPNMIDGLRRRGFEFVTVSELIAEEGGHA